MLNGRMPHLMRWGLTGCAALILGGTSIAAAPKKPPAGNNAAQVSQGKKLYENLGCGNCHQIAGQGGAAGPKLDGSGKRRNKDFLTKKLVNPKFNQPTSVMPPVAKPSKDIQALVAYMMSLK
jgi:mono/diheme cytochrome c family protein